MSEFNIRMHIPQTMNFSPQRQNDRNIMDIIVNTRQWNRIIEQINICRQFLKIIYLSDITTPDGEYISTDILQMTPNISSYEWPHIPNPPIKLQQVWTSTIQNVFFEKKYNKLLRQYKLDLWIIPPRTSHTILSFYTSSHTNAIYNIINNNNFVFNH